MCCVGELDGDALLRLPVRERNETTDRVHERANGWRRRARQGKGESEWPGWYVVRGKPQPS